MENTLPKNKRTLGILIAIISSIAFGAYPPAARAVYHDGGNDIFIILVTTWARALSLIGFCLVTNKAVLSKSGNLKAALSSGFFQAISITGILAALNYLPGPIVIIIIFTHTLMLLFFTAWRKEIELNAVTILTTAIALIGLSFVLNIWNQSHPLNLTGLSLAFMAAVATMSRLYVYGKQTRNRHPAIIGAEAFLFTGLFVSTFVLFKAPVLPVSAISYVWTGIACLSLVLGTFGMFYGIALIGSFQFSLFAKLEPVFTALFSFVFIDEVLNWTQYSGILIVILSLVSYQYFNHRKEKPA